MNTSDPRPKKSSAAGNWLSRLTEALTTSRGHCRPCRSVKKVLIVDDDQVVRKTIAAKLTKYGYKVVTALDASEAIGVMRDEQPDVVLLDITFPPDVANGGRVTWDGFQIMYWLRGLKEASRTRYIFITGSPSPEDKRRALAGGAAGYFVKPIDHKALLPAIERALA